MNISKKPVIKKVYVEITNACNLNCIMCIRRAWNAEIGYMKKETLDRALDFLEQLGTVDHVDLTGMGETLVHPQALEYIKVIRKRFPEVLLSFTTNLSLLKDNNIRTLAELFDTIYVSLDSLDEEKLKRIRTPGPSGNIISILRVLSKYKEQSDLKLGVSFLAMKNNIDELPVLISKAAELGIDKIQVSNLIPYMKSLLSETLYTIVPGEIIEILTSLDFKELEELNYYLATRTFSLVYGVDDPKLISYMKTYLRLLRKADSRNVSLNVEGYLREIEKIKTAFYTNRVFNKTLEIAREKNIEVELPRQWPIANSIRCPFEEFHGIVIRWDGVITPCQRLMYTHSEYFESHQRLVKEYHLGSVTDKHVITRLLEDNGLSRLWHRLRSFKNNNPWCGECPFAYNGCPFLRDTENDCLGSNPSCSDCLYAAGITKCP